MTRPSRSSKKTTDSQVEKKGGYPSGGKPINLLPKVPKGPGPSSPTKQQSGAANK